jgi:eukaryotic-like serine/threonine-protein kinase
MTNSQIWVAGRYRLVEQLGAGGMGTVWRARDEVLRRDVAIKEVAAPEGLTEAEREELRQRTMREAQTAAQLNHPHVVGIYDAFYAEGHAWIVMEYIPSRSLYQVMTEDEPLAPERVAHIGLAVLAALKAAHDAGVLHRDVKPGNVLLADDGRVVLTDFGLAVFDGGDGELTRPGLILGSAQYLAPERASDGVSSPEGDLWSLGATLYAAVEGQSPYARPTTVGTLTALATEWPETPRRAGPLGPVLNALLRKDPRARPSLAETERLLRQAATGEWPAPPRPDRSEPAASPESAGAETAPGVGPAGTSGLAATAGTASVDAESVSVTSSRRLVPQAGPADRRLVPQAGPADIARGDTGALVSTLLSGSPGSDDDEPSAHDPYRRRMVAVVAATVVLVVAATLLIDLIASGSSDINANARTLATVPTPGAAFSAEHDTPSTPASGSPSPSPSRTKRSVVPSPVRSGGGGTTNLALHRTTAESSHTETYGSDNACDGDVNSYWESANNALPQWVQVDLGAATAIGRIVLKLPPSPAWGTRSETLSVLGSDTGSSFSTIVGSAGYTFDPATGNTVTIRFASTSPRYVRLNVTSTMGWPAGQVSEIEVYAP